MDRHSATTICREALVSLLSITHSTPEPAPAGVILRSDFWKKSQDRSLHASVLIGVSYNDLELDLGQFSRKYISPAMYRLHSLVWHVRLSSEFLSLPSSVPEQDKANERYQNIAMRTVIADIALSEFPEFVGETRLDPKYYDLTTDEFISTQVIYAIRFNVHG